MGLASGTAARRGAAEEEEPVKIGLHIADFTYPSGPAGLADDLTRIVTAAEEAGFARISVMDHVWQIANHGPPEHEMLEAYTTLGYLAARTSRVDLLAWVTAATYRSPGMLAKLVSTLDVLSGGRAWLGIGAGWNEPEATGLGLEFPPLRERFERLEETLQICRQMWGDSDDPYQGKHYRLDRTLNAPQPLNRPRILIGGGGEQKTLRFVARYGDACNVQARVDVRHKLEVLRGHCAAEGRPYEEIEKTVQLPLDLGDGGENLDAFLARLRELSALGVQAVQGKLPKVWELDRIAFFGREVIPAAAEL
jgi:F420-dependent oxidoreductase-like protein